MKKHRTEYGASISEFGAVFGLFVLMLLLPLIDLLMVGLSTMIIHLQLAEAVREASLTTDLPKAQESIKKSNKSLTNLPLLNLMHIEPSPGSDGIALSLKVTNLKSGAISKLAGSKMMLKEIARDKELYEYSVGASFDVTPFLCLSGVPGLNTIPGLGKAMTIKYAIDYPVEHPASLLRDQDCGD